jgi:hypothetical protein
MSHKLPFSIQKGHHRRGDCEGFRAVLISRVERERIIKQDFPRCVLALGSFQRHGDAVKRLACMFVCFPEWILHPAEMNFKLFFIVMLQQ